MFPLVSSNKVFSIFLVILSASTSFAFESTRFKLKQCGTEQELNSFCKDKGYQGYSSVENHETYCYVTCVKDSDKEIDGDQVVSLFDDVLHDLHFLEPPHSECTAAKE